MYPSNDNPDPHPKGCPIPDAGIFTSESQLGKDSSREVDKLHAKIGQLTMENDFLAKVLGR